MPLHISKTPIANRRRSQPRTNSAADNHNSASTMSTSSCIDTSCHPSRPVVQTGGVSRNTGNPSA